MTEQYSQYGISTSLPVASPPTYLLLIDSRVSNYQDIINAKQPGVYHIVFDAATRPTHSKILIKNIEEQIAALGVPAFTSIGLVQHNDGRPIYEMFGRISDRMKPVISNVATRDPDIQTWNRISLFITMLRTNYGIVNFDMMACALYSDPNWKHVIDKLTAITGVTVRASTDDTGAASLGGDWFLESHTGANLKDIYFTEAIENYTGVLYTTSNPGATTAKKLILIDNRIKDIDVIMNSMNDDTYCLVFNYFYDTPTSILSKLRFLSGNNRYILDHFHYEPPTLPTRMDASGNHCTPCDDFDTNDLLLAPGILENEYLEYTMSGGDVSGNGGVWPFYSESTNITIQKPVFFQRAKIGETTETVPHGSTDGTVVATNETIVLNYKPRPMVLVSDLDAFYELGQNVGEIGSMPVAFDCVGIIQHTVEPSIGYKFVGGSDDTVAHAIIQDVISRDSSLSSWAPFTAFIQAMKTAHQMATLDLMACALYANPDWKYVIDTLAARENITIRASLDNTGSGTAEDEANWVLETDNVSLTTVYFTDKIYEWKYVLATYIDTRFNALRWNDSMYATRGYDSRLKIAAGTNNFTIETWYYEPTSNRNDQTIVDMGDYNYTFQIRSGGANYISLNNYSTGWIHSTITITPGQWNHIAVTRSGSSFTFYLNGTARQVITNSASLYSNNSTFAIGWQSPDTCQCNRMKTDSILYDIRLWNVARTATEIQMFRNRIVPANSTGLVANYLCTDNGTTLNDRSANALHTTIQNYNSARWSNNTVTIPNIGFLINNGYSLTTSNTGTALNAFTHFDNITYTDFSGVDLSGVNFRGADLTGCNFTNANLTNTNFANAYLINATTTNAITTGSNIAQAITNLTSTVVTFDGVDDGIIASEPSWSSQTQYRNTFTGEVWFKTSDTAAQKGTSTFVAHYGLTAKWRIHMLPNGQVDLWIVTTGGWDRALTTLSYNDTLWHHVAATYNSSGGLITLYIDGVSVVSRTHAYPGPLPVSTATTPIMIGSDYDGTGFNHFQTDRQFRGQISDVRIWNVVRSASEIAASYQRRLVGNETGLLGYWKLNQGYGSGWATYNRSLDSTSNRAHGTLTNMGATPSSSWVVSNLNFQPEISTLTLGPNNGVYNADVSFSFIDPSSNSLGDFTYGISPTTVATITNGAATTKTIFATTGAISIPTLSLYNFPEIASLSSWQIDVSFTVTGGTNTWRALVGDMYNEVNTSRGWGLWVSSSNRIHWSWLGATSEPATISVSLNTAYVLTAAQSSGTITLTLRTVSSGATQTGSFSVGANVIGKGPVTIGGWRSYSGENFPGTISYVNVSVPTNQRVVTLSSSTDGTPATVTATQASLLDYSSGSRTASLTVNKATTAFSTSFANVTRTNYQTFSLTIPVSNSNGAFSFTSSNTSVATINPAVTINALQFNGTTNFVDFGANIVELGKSSFTIECWLKTSGTSMGLLNCQDSDSTWESGEKSLYIDGNGIPAFVGFGCGWIYSTVAVNDNTWHHIALSWSFAGGSSGTAAIFIDGINRTSTNYSIYNQFAANTNNLGTFVFGKPNYSESVNFFNGAVCELRIWNVARSASEIYQNYRRLLVGNETGLVAYNRFNQGVASGTNTTVTTVSNNLQSGGYTGTLSGAFTLTGSSSNWVSGLSILPSYDVNVLNNGTTTITASQETTPKYTSLSATMTLTVNIPAPTISALTIPSKNFGDASFNLTAPTSNSGGAFTYTSSNTAVATVTSGGTVTIVGAGTTTITATQAATTNYTGGSVTASLVVSPIAPTIGTLTAPAKNFGDASFNLTAPTSNSGGAFTYTSSNTAVATVTSGGTVTIVGAGSTTITATQAASGNYASGSVSASLVVSPIAPTIGTLTAPAKNFGDASFNLTAPTSNSGGAFSYTSSNTAVATVTSGGTVTIVGAGTTTITATQAATTNYTGGSVSASLVVSAIAPTIGTLSAPAKNFGDASFNLTAPTSNSGGAFSYTSSNTAVATVTSGGTVTIVGAGSTTITATQAATTNYTGGSVSASLVVSAIAPTIGTLTAPAKNFGDASFNLTAPTSNSGGAFTYTSSNTAVATVTSGGTVTIVGAGSTTITATQAASSDGNYTGGSANASLVVSAIAPTIGTLSAPAKNFGDASFNLTAPTSNSGGAFSYTSSNTAVATVTSGGTVTIMGAGSTTITATQAATTNYTGGSVTASLVVSPIAPTIGTLTAPAKNFGDASFNLTAPTSNSGGAFTYTSSNTAVATVTSSGGVVTVIGAGSTTITATQAASSDGNYTGGSVTASLVVSPIAPTIGTLTAPAKNFGDASFNMTAPTSNSGGAFSYTSSNTGVATVTSSGGVVTVIGAGSTTITATQAASSDGNYTSGSVTASLVVSAIAPTIGTLTAPAKNFGDASFNLTAPTSNSGGAFSYTSSNTSVATVTSGGTVTVVGAGSTTITATQAASSDGNYTGGSSVTGSLVVSPAVPTFGTFTITEKFINDISFTLTAPSSNSNGAFTFSTDASGSAIATVTSGGLVTLTGVAGTATITATQAASANGNYITGSVSASLIVNAALSNFTVPSNKVYADAAFDLTDPTTIYSGEPFLFTSSDTTVASIGGAGGRTVTIHKAGSTTITAKQVATGAHSELTITAVLTIAKKTTVITSLSTITKNYGDASFNISPTSNNTDTGSNVFTITSRDADIISIFDVSYAAITGIGSVVIDISQSETTNFTSGTTSVSIVVSKGTPILSAFTVSANRTYGSAPFSALAYPTSASNGTITYSSSDSTVASIDSSSGIITLLKAGYVNFTATQAATAYYNSTTKTSNTMTVHRKILPLTRSSPTSSTINKTYGDGYFNVIATNDSNGGTITYETDNPSVAGIVGSATAGVISVVSVGTATITARRGQTDQYTSEPVSWTVEVARTTTTLTGLSDLSYNVTAAPFTVSASSASDGVVSYSLQDPSSNVLVIHPTTGLVTLRSAGSAVIVASQAQGTLYLAPTSITATITVSSAGNALQGATITSTASFAAVNLEGASLAGVSITNTAFTAAKLSNANLTNAVIVSANFASADLSGATLAGATITGATFTAASLKNADLSGAVLTNTAFTGSDLSGARLTGVDASGASFANAKLTNVDMTGANIANVNFTNTSIKGANIADVSFSPLQKLQLLKNSDNRDIGQIIIPAVTGTTVLAAVSETSPLRAIQNLDLATATVAVVVPTTSTSPTDVLPDVVLNVAESDKFYLPINESEFFQIEGVKYFATDGVVRNYLTNAVVEVINYNGTPVWLLAGSIVGLVLQTNTLNSSPFVVPSTKLVTDTSPFMPTTLPTSNNTETPIVYSSSNTNIATINASSGEITVTGNTTGFVYFTATQVQNATYEPGTSVSNRMLVDNAIHFSLTGLNQTFNLSTLATLDASSISVEATDATAIFYVPLSDINNVFKYQSDAFDVTNAAVEDIKYYVFHRKWPTELKLNPVHAMMDKTESAGMLGVGEGYSGDKSLTKHDFIRYIALRLFNTIHGVDLFHNELELNENSVFLGETVRNNIDTILSGISTTSSSGTMSYDASGNKYLTNDASGNTNLCREIMRHMMAVAPSRFYGNIPNHAGLKNVPFIENDTLQYKLVVQAAASQNMLTGVSEIPSRSYTIKVILKNTVSASTNTNTVITDSEMYPNSYPYSSSVVTYPPTTESSGVYNLYSPPAPIPFARFGYNGWYYANSTTWVNVAPAVRNHIKWLVGGNTVTSTVGDLQYIRINLKIHNTASLPYVMIYTQAGSSRKYAVVSGNGSLTNGTVYSFYMNFNSYARDPAYISHTNAALGYTIGAGSFANNETITSIALESDSNAAAGNVEFTLSSMVVGELSTTTNLKSEKEYGFEAAVPEAYP